MMGAIAIPGSKLEIVCWSAPTVGENLALDDALARAAWESGRRVLRFWWGGPPAVVVGSSERPDHVVDEAVCAKLGVDVLKRSTGGGSVLQTFGVLNYALVTPAPARLDLKGAYRLGTDLICAILGAFGLTGAPQGTSDVAVCGRKISGNAQAWRWKALLVHGTLMVDFDYDLAEKVLRPPVREPAYRQGRSHREFIVTLRELGVRADRDTIERTAIEAARAGFPNVVVTSHPASRQTPSTVPAEALPSRTAIRKQKPGSGPAPPGRCVAQPWDHDCGVPKQGD